MGGAPVLIAARPEHVGVDLREPGDGAAGRQAGTVEAVEPLISERAQLLHVALAGHASEAGGPPVPAPVPVPVTVTARLPLGAPGALADLGRGTAVWLRLDPERLLLFDPATERALPPGAGGPVTVNGSG